MTNTSETVIKIVILEGEMRLKHLLKSVGDGKPFGYRFSWPINLSVDSGRLSQHKLL